MARESLRLLDTALHFGRERNRQFPQHGNCDRGAPARRRLRIVLPFGVDDLFKLVVRPNKVQITAPIYEAKVARWRPLWPHLTFVPWSENPRDYGKLDSNAQKVRRADNIA